MFRFFRQRKLQDTETRARKYVQDHYQPEKPVIPITEHKPKPVPAQEASSRGDFRYSDRGGSNRVDQYQQKAVDQILRKASAYNAGAISKALENTLDRTFHDKLLDIIDQKDLHDTEVYRRANIDRRLYSKIMSDRDFRPAKDTALALIFALQLDPEEAKDLLARAGYTLSHSNKRDVMIEFFIREKIYDLININIMLDDLGQKMIGR